MTSVNLIRPVLGTCFLIFGALFHSELCAEEKPDAKPPTVEPQAPETAPKNAGAEEKKKEEGAPDSPDAGQAKKQEPKAESPAGDTPKPVPARRGPSGSGDSLRLDVGGGGLLLPPQEGVSGGTSLGPLPDFKRPSIPTESTEASEEPAFPDIEMRRRARPDLIPDGPNPTEDAAIALRDRIRYRSVKTQALRDGAVREALAASVKARSDREMREALKRHYSLLFGKMRALDSSLAGLIEEREAETFEKLRPRVSR